MFIPTKPRKCGMKIWLLADTENACCCNLQVYPGRHRNERNRARFSCCFKTDRLFIQQWRHMSGDNFSRMLVWSLLDREHYTKQGRNPTRAVASKKRVALSTTMPKTQESPRTTHTSHIYTVSKNILETYTVNQSSYSMRHSNRYRPFPARALRRVHHRKVGGKEEVGILVKKSDELAEDRM